jgi:polysaccharide biosynthesis protein PslG
MRLATVMLVWLFLLVAVAGAVQLPSATVPAGICVQIEAYANYPSYFRFSDLDMMQAAGIKVVRDDFSWPVIEATAGHYDFTYYNQVQSACAAHGIRVLWSLDHWNDSMYPADQTAPTVVAWRQAYANFAAAAVSNFRGSNCMFEIWNEPDMVNSWPGGASNNDSTQRANQYMALVQQAVPAMRQADPNCTILGASISSLSYMDFARPCLDQGLLSYVDAVSFHPYRTTNPETAVTDYTTLRNLINGHSPSKPMVASEWGYSSDTSGQFPAGSPQKQGDYFARALLVNLSQNVPLTNWYVWADDAYGIVTSSGAAKPAYSECQLLTRSLWGETFSRKLYSPYSDVWLLEFTGSGQDTLAAWTTNSNGRSVYVSAWGGWLTLTGTPQYIHPSTLPEPGTFMLFGTGLIGFLAYLWRKRK